MAEPTASVIFLHGLGDCGESWSCLQQEAPVPWARWSFPDAPRQSVSCNMGMSMPSWFDLKELPLSDAESAGAPSGVEKAVNAVHAMLRQSESLGFVPERTVLGGFSQGAALSLLAGLTYEKPLGGIIALSGWSMRRRELHGLIRHKHVPIFIGHGEKDPTVPYDLGEAAERALRRAGCTNVEFHSYKNLSHSAHREEFRDVRSFLRSCLPKSWSPACRESKALPEPLESASKSQVVVKLPNARRETLDSLASEMKEEDGQLRILVYLQGLDVNQLEVDLSSGVLIIRGQRQLELQLPKCIDPELATSKFSSKRQTLTILAPLAGS
eukprot:TRINITY_DN74132_c0_g1_i1.p1 TRINITY_DN74132_c0_g1~~TRINITY_DN74132_c0_g1_i1.p1  ORF type:complete len:355 (-),score=40.95 TRINITY_DN74132_c0_g1_i1:50-1027(-)